MDWDKINSEKFEKLCCEYARANYREFLWEPTPHSWDGNKDGEFVTEIDSLHRLVKGWYESKYTIHPNQSIPHSHMDSTLVSGILDGNVVYILFITNGKITQDFKRRANAVLHPHRIDVNFVDGEILEEWLLDNPDIYTTFFRDDNSICKKGNTPKLIIEDVCFFDCVLCSPTLAEPVKRLAVGNEYFLYIGVRSNTALECSISINTDCLRIFSNNTYNVSKFLQIGYNSLFLKCQARGSFRGKLQLKMEATDKHIYTLWEQKDLIIYDDFCPKIFYYAQLNAIHEMYDFLQINSSDNAILSVIGPEGSGKSFLHRKLIESLSKDQHECLSIQLSEKRAENACSLCKLILFLNFGYLYKLSEEAFCKLIESSINLPLELFAKLREGASNQITALYVMNEIVQLLKDNVDYALLPIYNMFMHRRTSYVFIDDLQKIDVDYAQIFQILLSEFYSRKFSQIMIVGYRAREFYDPQLESIIQGKCQKNWIMGQLSQEDIKATLSCEFNANIGELSELFPQPLNVLHLVMLVKQLRKNNITRLNSLKASASYSEAYKAVNSQNNQFAKHKIELAKYTKEIYLIYKIESGIPKNILFGFWGTDANKIYSELASQNLVREDNGRVVPFHDAYLYAFHQQKINPCYLNELIRLLNYIRKLENTYPTLESNLISILITDGDMSTPNLRKSAYQYCREYYNISQYYAAKLIAKSLLPDIDTAGSEQFNEEMIKILYIYAQSVKFTESHVRSTQLFRKLIQITSKNDIFPEIRDIGLDALSEVLNNEMWMLNFEETNKCLQKLGKLKISISTTSYGENAYLNYLNRKMMCESFYTSKDCIKSYMTSLSESKRLKRNDYEAYAKMDCARILYPISPHVSIDLLKDARSFFVVNRKFYRRLLECKAEIVFLENLLFSNSFDELYNIQKEMLSQGYINSYTKTIVKILTIELSIGAIPPETVRIRLNRLTLQNPDAIINKRISIAIYQLLSLCAFIECNESDLIKFSKMHLDLVSQMNEGYKCIPQHNLSCSPSERNLSWVIGEHIPESAFWLDPRLW